jgi:hypothetical protein
MASSAEQRKYNDALKEAKEIQDKIDAGVNVRLKTLEKLVNAEKIILAYDEKITKENEKLTKEKDKQIAAAAKEQKVKDKMVSLDQKLLKLAKSSTGQILQSFGMMEGLTKSTSEAGKESGKLKEGYNLATQAQMQAIEELKAGTFDSANYVENVKDQLLALGPEGAEAFGVMEDSLEKFAQKVKDSPDLGEKLKVEADAQQKIDDFKDKVAETSALLSSPKAMGVAAVGLLVKLMKDFAQKALEVRQSLGTTAVESARLAGNITAASVAAKVVGGSSQEAEAAVIGLVQEFGSLSVVSAGVSAKLGLMTGQFGISGANAAKLLKSMEAINGASIETNLNLISSVGELARAEGVAPAQVLNDIAESTDTFAKFAKDGGQNIAKAAIEARKLGLNLSTVAGIAESLLDFESSIEKEMEASMLLGRQMNLDKARELALSGKLAELAEEVKNQVGSQADFEAMNVVQRKALADAMGVTVADMGKMVAGEKTSAEEAEERVVTEKKQADLQMAMMGTMVGMQSVQAAIVALEAVRGGLLGKNLAKTVASAGASLAKGAGAIFSGFGMIPFGLGIPLAIAAVAGMFALAKKATASVPSAETGGVVTKSGIAKIDKGEAFSGTKNEMGFGTDMTETNNYLKQSLAESKKLREQNEFLMNRLTGRVDGLALSN